jgi:hypothetical protein
MVKKLTIVDAIEIALKHGGKCLSTAYVNNHADLSWRCGHGHDFSKPLKRVKLGEWCPICSGKYVLFTASELSKIAEHRGGKYLSNKNLKVSEYANWECSNGHKWNSQVNNVVNLLSWCPLCKTNTGEEICRYIFERFTNEKFPSKRPKWLRDKNQTRSMELDGFCERLGIAFEHQGKQHYEDGLSHFQSKNVIFRDAIKREICKQNDVSVLEIPQINHYITINDAIKLIKDFLIEHKCEIYNDVTELDVKNNRFSLYDETLIELQNLAKSKGGRCLSNTYLGHVTPLEFECDKHHKWFARPNDIKRGSWCSICSRAGGKKKTIHELNNMYESLGIKCNSETYSNSKEKYLWECKNGHIFQSRYDKVINGCPMCKKSLINNIVPPNPKNFHKE